MSDSLSLEFCIPVVIHKLRTRVAPASINDCPRIPHLDPPYYGDNSIDVYDAWAPHVTFSVRDHRIFWRTCVETACVTWLYTCE